MAAPAPSKRTRGRRPNHRATRAAASSAAVMMSLLLSTYQGGLRPLGASAAASAFVRTAAARSSSMSGTREARHLSRSLCASDPSTARSSSRSDGEGTAADPAATAHTAKHEPYYARLSHPRRIVAPMVAQSDLPFRLLCRRYGADLSYTQMIHAKNFLLSEEFQYNHLDVYRKGEELGGLFCGSQLNALDGGDRRGHIAPTSELRGQQQQQPATNYPNEGPVIVQLAGHDPAVVSEAAQLIVERTEGNLAGIDLNLGCPQGIARKGRYGAHLMEESPKLVCEILQRLREDLPSSVGVSAKMRIPEDEIELKDRIRRMVDAGVDLITVHGRTVKENKTKVRGCNWDSIRLAADTARVHSGDGAFPVFANGGIEYPSDIPKCLEYTGASGAMVSESLLENPSIFAPDARDEADMSPREIFDRQITLASEYLDLAALYPPVPGSLGKVGGSFNVVRSHVFKMLYRYLEEHPDLRKRLADRATVSIPAAREVVEELKRRGGALRSDREWDELKSSGVGTSWYRRHRDAEGRVHRRGDVHLSGANGAASAATMSVDDRKQMMKERIRRLRDERERKEAHRRRGGGERRGKEEMPVAA